MRLLRFNNHIINTNNIDSFFKCFRCPSCYTFFQESNHFNKHLIRCTDRVRQIYPNKAYTVSETIFEKLDGFNIPYNEDYKLFSNVAIFDFESICVPTAELKATETTTWMGKHVPISVSISSNLQDDLFLLREKVPEFLINAFVSSLELLAEKCKLQMRTMFQEIENIVNDRVKKIFDKLNARSLTKRLEVFDYEYECVEDVEEDDMSTQFLRIQKNQLIDLKRHLELFVDTLPVFGSIAAEMI